MLAGFGIGAAVLRAERELSAIPGFASKENSVRTRCTLGVARSGHGCSKARLSVSRVWRAFCENRHSNLGERSALANQVTDLEDRLIGVTEERTDLR